jgi:hypothetical protein
MEVLPLAKVNRPHPVQIPQRIAITTKFILGGIMELWEQISRQRAQHIVDSYQLYGEDIDDFEDYLEELLLAYQPPQIERAIVETLVSGWFQLPLVKGIPFIEAVHDRLKAWEVDANMPPTISPAQFQQITGLDPAPVFGHSTAASLHQSRS